MPQDAAAMRAAAEGPARATVPRRGRSGLPTRIRTSKSQTRRFADPFDDDESGANCFRCGYLVEQARESRGLMTCSKCG
jgi:hypothetical protein